MTDAMMRRFGPALSARVDERRLWAELLAGARPREAGEALGIPWKRVAYLCEKWASAGFYDYGVTCDTGWPDFYAGDFSDPSSEWHRWHERREHWWAGYEAEGPV